jgi:hypothetical protein
MQSLQAVQSLSEFRRQTPVCLGLVDEQRVTTGDWAIEQIQKCGAGRLLLVCYVGVPGHCRCASLQDLWSGTLICATVDEVDFRVSLRSTGSRVDMVTAEI